MLPGQRSHTLQQALLKAGADAHDLAGGLHLSTQGIGGGGKLIKGETGELGDAVIKPWLKGRIGVGDLDVLKEHSHGDLGGNAGDGVARGLGGQSRRAGHAGVDLDEVILAGVGIERELDVTAALDLQLADELDGGIVEHLLVMLGQGHDGSHHDGVAGVNAHG